MYIPRYISLQIDYIHKEGLQLCVIIMLQQLKISLYTTFVVHLSCARATSTRLLAELSLDYATMLQLHYGYCSFLIICDNDSNDGVITFDQLPKKSEGSQFLK